jgi:hypothetical protein
MSAETISRIRKQLVPKAEAIKTHEDGRAFIRELVETLARDLAETVYLNSLGESEHVLREMHSLFLIKQIDAVCSTLIEHGIDDPTFLEMAIVWSGDAFHGRFIELDARRIGGLQ